MKSLSEIVVEFKEKRRYHVIVGRGVLKFVQDFLDAEIEPLIALVGSGVASQNKWVRDDLSSSFRYVEVVDDGEHSKELNTALKIIDRLWELGASRWSALACAAGGSLGDTAAFASSIYMRGIPFINIPTTLLAMIDSSIGGKTAVNYKKVKNIIGSFYHPYLVVDDIRFLETLPNRVYKSSLAEALKYGFTLSKEFLEFLTSNKATILNRSSDDTLISLISQSVHLKINVVAKDPQERLGIREVLNYGHTVGHAIESISNYSILHGEAVAIGMIVETALSEQMGCNECYRIVESVIKEYGILDEPALRASLPNLTFEEYKSLLSRDKKKIGDKIRWPMLTEIGKWKLVLMDFEYFAKETFKHYKSLLKQLKT